MKTLYHFSLLLFLFCISAKGQQSLDTIKAPAKFENIYSRVLHSDSLASSFVIFIKNEVKPHKHAEHSEQVLILEGNGEMTMGDKTFKVKRGDLIYIPKGTFHSVKTMSKMPLKVLSVQAPYFDGKDRIFKN
jgi:mannose-6-phosphate isomerase-like protein (cupin superfamily)